MASFVDTRRSETRLPTAAGRLAQAKREAPVLRRHGKKTEISCPNTWKDSIPLRCENSEEFNIRCRSIAGAEFADIVAPPVKVTQGDHSPDEDYRIHVILLLEGYGTHRWAGGSFRHSPGDIVILDTNEPSEVDAPTSSHLLRWSIPADLIQPFIQTRGYRPVMHLPGKEGLLAVLARHMNELAHEVEYLDIEVQSSLLSHLCGLLGLAVEMEYGKRPKRRCNYRAYQKQRIINYVEAHLADNHLSARKVADDLRISTRWLHALLEDEAESFSNLVANRRLQKSHVLLRDPASRQMSIAEIAFLAGFNDLSTFYRRFKDRYGVSPGRLR